MLSFIKIRLKGGILMDTIILYTLADDASKEAEDLLRSTGIPFEIQPHLFSDTDKPVVRRKNGELLIGLPEIRTFFIYDIKEGLEI